MEPPNFRHRDIGIDIGPKGDFNDMVNTHGSQGFHPFNQPLVIENDFVRARRLGRRLLRRRAHRADHVRARMSPSVARRTTGYRERNR